MTPGPTPAERTRLRRRGLRLEWATIAWNLGEFFVTVGLGIAAGSIALIGFGLDSLIEVFASSVVVWHVLDGSEESPPERSRRALRLIAVAFVVLGVALLVGVVQRLVSGVESQDSPLGIVYLAVTALVMFGLAIAKRRVADRLGSVPLRAEARITFLDGMLATGVLAGLVLNALLGFWWADPLAAGLVGVVALNEGREHWRETSAGPAADRSRSKH